MTWGEWRSCLHERPLVPARVLGCYESFDESERARARVYLANALDVPLEDDVFEQLWAHHRAPFLALPAGTLRLWLVPAGMSAAAVHYIDWAIEAMLRGFDAEPLVLLAGMSREDRTIDARAL